jgi:hypothetical protein
VAYSDDDFYFYPGWLEAQLEVLDAFPKVGMVSGYAIPTLFSQERTSATLEFGRSGEAELTRGKFIPQEWIRDWALSTGRDPAEEISASEPLEEFIVEYRGVSAFASANHDQFIAPRAVIQECLPAGWSGRLMGGMLELDEAVNRAGYLRLTTRQRTTLHLGNRLSEDIAANLPAPAITRQGARRSGSPPMRRLLRWAPVRSLLLGIYSRLFRMINPE